MDNFSVAATVTITDPYVNMGSDDHSVFSNDGLALFVHAEPECMKSDPSGNPGDQIGCGEIAKEVFPNLTAPAAP
jgi:Cu/Zn superoxide dismutase